LALQVKIDLKPLGLPYVRLKRARRHMQAASVCVHFEVGSLVLLNTKNMKVSFLAPRDLLPRFIVFLL
jgi:hypothetical protein